MDTYPTAVEQPTWRRPARREWCVLAIVLLTAAGLRGLYLAELADHPDLTVPGVDAGTHQYWARGLATGDWTPPEGRPDPGIPRTPFVRPPGYPYVLALIYALAGTGPWAPRVVQMVLGLLNCVLAWAIGRRWFGAGLGLTWSALMALYWSLIYFEGELQATTLFVSLLLVLVYVLGRWAEGLAPVYAVVAGLVLGVASLVRPNALPIAAAVAGWMVWVARGHRSARKGWVGASTLVLCTVAGILPATVRNALVADDFVLISANGGINLFIGNNDMATGRPSGSIAEVGRFANCYDYPGLVATLEHRLGRPLKYSEVSAHFRDRAVEYVRGHPRDALRLVLTKALLFWGPWEIANNKEVHYERVFSGVLSRLPGDFPALVALALAGGGMTLFHRRRQQHVEARAHLRPGCLRKQTRVCGLFHRRRQRHDAQRSARASGGSPWQQGTGSEHGEAHRVGNALRRGACPLLPRAPGRAVLVLMGLIIVTLFLAVLPFFVCARYRVPVTPFLLFFGAHGLCRVAGWISARQWVRWSLWAVGVIGAYLALRVPWVAGGPDLFRWHYDRGTAYERLGDADRALAEYEETLRMAPDVPLARIGAANLLLVKGRVKEAADHLRYILRYVHPHRARAHALMARVLRELGETNEAMRHYRECLRIRPVFVSVRMELARFLRDLDRFEHAAAEYELVLTAQPQNVDALFESGLALRAAGRMDAGERRLRRAVQLDSTRRAALEEHGITLADASMPDATDVRPESERANARALVRQADRLAQVGRVREALELYAQALALKPNSPILHCRVGEVLAGAGDFTAAAEHYRKAVAADPDLAAAHVGLGMTYGRLDDPERAVRHYRAAVRIEPDNLAAYYNLGIALGGGLGRFEEGIEALNAALRLSESTGRDDLSARIADRIRQFRAILEEGTQGHRTGGT